MSSAAKARREDKNKNYAQQMQDFANDSVNFFNKCAKPDKTGKYLLEHSPCRVHEDPPGVRDGLRCDRLHRLHHQACVHSHQQHNPRRLKADNIDNLFSLQPRLPLLNILLP